MRKFFMYSKVPIEQLTIEQLQECHMLKGTISDDNFKRLTFERSGTPVYEYEILVKPIRKSKTTFEINDVFNEELKKVIK